MWKLDDYILLWNPTQSQIDLKKAGYYKAVTELGIGNGCSVIIWNWQEDIMEAYIIACDLKE